MTPRDDGIDRISDTTTGTGTGSATGTATSTRMDAQGGLLVRAVLGWAGWMRAARRLARRAGAWLARTVTVAGWYALAAAALGLTLGFGLGWGGSLIVGLLAAVLLAGAIPFLLGKISYRVGLALDVDRVTAGDRVSATLSVENTSGGPALPATLDIPIGQNVTEARVPAMRADGRYQLDLALPTERRGIVTVGPVTATKRDPLGLLRRQRTWTDRHLVHVHPKTARLESLTGGLLRDLEGMPSTQIVNSDISFHAIREYAVGDERRHIHWKSTAKTGRLMVRQFEESRRSRISVILSIDSDNYASDDEFEIAVSAVGSLGLRAFHDSRALTVTVGDRLPEYVKRAVSSVVMLNSVTPRSMLDALSGVQHQSGIVPLVEVCRLASENTPDLSLAFLVCGSTVPLRTIRQAALKFPIDATVIAIQVNEYAQPRIQVAGSLTVVTIAVLDDLAHLMLRQGAR